MLVMIILFFIRENSIQQISVDVIQQIFIRMFPIGVIVGSLLVCLMLIGRLLPAKIVIRESRIDRFAGMRMHYFLLKNYRFYAFARASNRLGELESIYLVLANDSIEVGGEGVALETRVDMELGIIDETLLGRLEKTDEIRIDA